MEMINRSSWILVIVICAVFALGAAKTLDPYKVLGVERNASQREIQKAFHKLSLQYHPDKNKNKGAQEKFAEINNAYDILSDEEKRKNYNLYGDEKGNPGFDPGNGGSHGGFTYSTSGGPGQGGFSNMGGNGNSKSFSFSFGGSGGQNPFGFGLDDIFSNFFGGDMGGGGASFGSSSSSKGSRFGSGGTRKSIHVINSQLYKKEILEKGMTWLLLCYKPSLYDPQPYESIIEDVANSLRGALKVGSMNCETESSLCKELGFNPRRSPKVFVYSFRTSYMGSFVEYKGDLSVKGLKTFCQEHLPRFSKRTYLSQFEVSSQEPIPKVMLLSTKSDTPVIWRVLSGLYRKRFIFYDAEVQDALDPNLRRWGVDAFPAIVGWLSNGERHILKSGITVKDVKTSVEELSTLLDAFENKHKKAASSRAKNAGSESVDKQIPLLSRSNFDSVCGESTPVCIFGAFRSSKGREKLEMILSSVSQKSLSRRRNLLSGSVGSISYALLDGSKYSSFLKAFEKSGFASSDKLLIAYKPRKGKFATFVGQMTEEEVEWFISSVLNGDVQFSKTRQKPTF